MHCIHSTGLSSISEVGYCTILVKYFTRATMRLTQGQQINHKVYKQPIAQTHSPYTDITKKLNNFWMLSFKYRPHIFVGMDLRPSNAIQRQRSWSSMIRVLVYRLCSAKLLLEPMLTCCQLEQRQMTSMQLNSKYDSFHLKTKIYKNAVCTLGTILFRPQCVTN